MIFEGSDIKTIKKCIKYIDTMMPSDKNLLSKFGDGLRIEKYPELKAIAKKFDFKLFEPSGPVPGIINDFNFELKRLLKLAIKSRYEKLYSIFWNTLGVIIVGIFIAVVSNYCYDNFVSKHDVVNSSTPLSSNGQDATLVK